METNLNNVRSLIVNTIQKSKNELVDILNKTGISTSYHDTKEKIRENVIKALAVSNKFQERLKELIAKNHAVEVKNAMGCESGKLGFVTQPLYQETLTLDEYGNGGRAYTGGEPFQEAIIFQPEFINTNAVGLNGTFNADGTPNSQGSTVDKVVAWLNKALGVYSDYVKQNPANESDKLAELQAQLEAEKEKSRKAWIVPTVLATIVTATAVYLFLKRKK